jgi:hypothetical protein
VWKTDGDLLIMRQRRATVDEVLDGAVQDEAFPPGSQYCATRTWQKSLSARSLSQAISLGKSAPGFIDLEADEIKSAS